MAYDPTDWSTADDTAKDTAQYFFVDSDGAHVTTTAGDPDIGSNVLIDSSGMFVRDNTDVLAEFKNPTIIGKTSGNEMNVVVGDLGIDTGLFLRRGTTQKLRLWGENGDNGGYLQSGDGCYLALVNGSLYVTPFMQSSRTILDTSGQSYFCIGGLHMYQGTFTKNVGSSSTTEATIWQKATFESTFNVKSGDYGKCSVFFSNGNYNAGALGPVGSECVTSGTYAGWHARWTVGATGGKQFNYLVVVPAASSTV